MARMIYDTNAFESERLALGLTIQQLAKRAGLAPATVTRFLDRERANPNTAKKIGKALGLERLPVAHGGDENGSASSESSRAGVASAEPAAASAIGNKIT